jgi:hypothetical protein
MMMMMMIIIMIIIILIIPTGAQRTGKERIFLHRAKILFLLSHA